MARTDHNYVIFGGFHGFLQFGIAIPWRKMRTLVIGSGGREHALCWKLARTPGVQLFAASGNPGIAEIANTVNTVEYAALAERIRPHLTIVGPEAPLVAGVVDSFRERGLAIVGPTAAAARIESSKAYAKEIMNRAGIPTARHRTAGNQQEAREALRGFGLPVVLKADGLAAGKGVIVAHTAEEAAQAILTLSNVSRQIVIEEFLTGPEVSFIALTDGKTILPFEPTQDHKTIFDGDRGPNTGGMGAYCDTRILTDAERALILDRVMEPAIHQMCADGAPFTGFLYAGLMMTPDGPRVLEFNARLGDPETQALMLRMSSDLAPALEAAAHGDLANVEMDWHAGATVCVVMAAHGYPNSVRAGDPISGLDRVVDATVFQAGTASRGGILQTNGGRVLGVTAAG